MINEKGFNIADIPVGEELIVGVCAKEECVAGKNVQYYPNEPRRYYALHYITHGNGALKFEDGEEKVLKPGDLFVIPPGKRVSYRTIDRWEYFWVNIEGTHAIPLLKCLGFSMDNLIVSHKRDMNLVAAFNKLIDSYYDDGDTLLTCKGHLYLIMGLLTDSIHNKSVKTEKRSKAFYIKEAVTFLEYNFYYAAVSLESLAKNLSINKNYLCSIFKKEVGVSPMQYLFNLRMKAACKRLKETEEPISSVSQFVGYTDALYFSKEFKRFTGVSPSQYRVDNFNIPEACSV